jgi:glycerol-3-phosphate dehydrogenase (NAD(P)+)
VISDETGNDHVFSISGPTFSSEMINGALSSVTLGMDKPECMRLLMNMLQAPNMLVDLSADVVGVELCGVLKNVYAVAMGIVDSNFYTYNEHYALLNLCFKEMVYILDAAGHGNLSEKFCAFGDFNLTANADKSRNRTLGLMIGKNISLNSAQSTVTFESIKSAKAIKEYSRGFSLNTPIVDFVNSAFNEPKDIRIQISRLINNIQNKIDYNCY